MKSNNNATTKILFETAVLQATFILLLIRDGKSSQISTRKTSILKN